MFGCTFCGAGFPPVAAALGVCVACARSGRADVGVHVRAVHSRSRRAFGLPAAPPRGADGARCRLCMNWCRIGPGERGYCGLRQNVGGRLVGGRPGEGRLSWYYDPLPTNCVADWVCPGGTGAGYPAFARRPGPEVGFANLAVFYEACSFNCLFCQNWHFRQGGPGGRETTARDLAARADGRTTCVCFFGGDPSPQMLHSIQAARLARRRARGGILRICWETNGSMHPRLLDRALDLALESGGCIKIDHPPSLPPQLSPPGPAHHIAPGGPGRRRGGPRGGPAPRAHRERAPAARRGVSGSRGAGRSAERVSRPAETALKTAGSTQHTAFRT